jgi:hypothetical protein
MRPAGIAIVGFISLIIVLVFVAYVQVILLSLAVIVCLLIVLGFVRDGRKPCMFRIATARKSGEESQTNSPNVLVKIEGRTFSVRDLPAGLKFAIRRRNVPLLFAIAVIAIGSSLVSLVGTDFLSAHIEPGSTRYFEFYFLAYFMVVLLFPALAWLSECTLMRVPAMTLANVGVRGRGIGGLWLAYQFTDSRGGYYGGTTLNLDKPKDDQLKLVFCNPRNPGINKLSCGLYFHEVVWVDTPMEPDRIVG